MEIDGKDYRTSENRQSLKVRWKQKESGRFADEAKDEGVMQTFADEEKEGIVQTMTRDFVDLSN